MKKIVFIGAGSFIFTRNLVRDIFTFPALQDTEIVLMDINKERLDAIEYATNKILEAGNYPGKITATMNRREALYDADAVICTILTDDISVWRKDLEIPMKYGVDNNIGDTRNPAGIFRALRTVPVMVDICKDMEQVCPKAVLLNYTNPMGMVCKAVQMQTTIKVIGLCHSVQHAVKQMADWIEKPLDEITYNAAGINHQAWILEFKHNGEDVYRLVKEVANREDNFKKDPVRVDMMNHLGYYVTESSGHNSEYNAWYRKKPEIMEKYYTKDDENTGAFGFEIQYYEKVNETWGETLKNWYKEEIDLKRGDEYAACILNALIGDGSLYKFYGNVLNKGYIDNLPYDSCVEVPVLVSKRGFEPISVGALPKQLALLNSINAQCEDLVVDAILTGDREKVYYAIYHDPLTSAVLCLEDIKKMVDEMFAANEPYLPESLKQ